MYERLLGIRQPQGSYGFEAVELAPPLVESIPSMAGRILTVRGEVALAWAWRGEGCSAAPPSAFIRSIGWGACAGMWENGHRDEYGTHLQPLLDDRELLQEVGPQLGRALLRVHRSKTANPGVLSAGGHR